MSAPAPAILEALAVSSSSEKLSAPFPLEIERVFNRLEKIEGETQGHDARNRPTAATLEWAREVLLRVMPSTYLIGAEINPFESEIHVTWEDDDTGKSVIVFFPAPNQLKIYHELVQNDAVVEHHLVNSENVSDVSERLRWFFQ
jgi:hypothetical protein